MKTILMVVFIVLNPEYGTPGDMMATYSYTPSYEKCVTELIPKEKKFYMTEAKGIAEFYGAMCAEITQEEEYDPINTSRKIWLGLPTE